MGRKLSDVAFRRFDGVTLATARTAMDGTPMDEDHPAWVWLKDLHDRGDHQTIEEMVSLWRSAQTLGRAGNIIRKGVVLLGKVLLWFAAIFAGWAVVWGDIGKYIGRQSGGL